MPKHGSTTHDREFEEFARARASQLYRSAWLLCGDSHQAEDLVQETLAKVYARWKRPLGGRIDNPAAYAQTTLARTFISGRRRRSSGEVPYADLPDAPAADPSDGSDLRLDLQDLLGGLSETDRAVLVLRFVEDLPVDEVAQRLELTPGAVKNRSMRALARARDRSTT